MTSGTQLGRVRGLGSAKHGSKHWIDQRVSALGNLLLTVWLVGSFFWLPSFEHKILAEWLAQPSVAVPMILMLVSIFWHVRLGLQVFIEDYAQDEGNKLISLMLLNFYVIGGVAFGIFTIAKHAFAGASA
ncbi:MAG: succinate dehydrogenase, hydrophobic membrane anchor protein [Sphingorhabdus sp.]